MRQPSGEENMETVRMLYRNYKNHYADCKTVSGSYDCEAKSIEVLVPDGRMKPSGVRGRKFNTIWLFVGDDNEHTFERGFKAIDIEHAIKQAKKLYKYVKV